MFLANKKIIEDIVRMSHGCIEGKIRDASLSKVQVLYNQFNRKKGKATLSEIMTSAFAVKYNGYNGYNDANRVVDVAIDSNLMVSDTMYRCYEHRFPDEFIRTLGYYQSPPISCFYHDDEKLITCPSTYTGMPPLKFCMYVVSTEFIMDNCKMGGEYILSAIKLSIELLLKSDVVMLITTKDVLAYLLRFKLTRDRVSVVFSSKSSGVVAVMLTNFNSVINDEENMDVYVYDHIPQEDKLTTAEYAVYATVNKEFMAELLSDMYTDRSVANYALYTEVNKDTISKHSVSLQSDNSNIYIYARKDDVKVAKSLYHIIHDKIVNRLSERYSKSGRMNASTNNTYSKQYMHAVNNTYPNHHKHIYGADSIACSFIYGFNAFSVLTCRAYELTGASKLDDRVFEYVNKNLLNSK